MKKCFVLTMVFTFIISLVPVSFATASTDLRFEINKEVYVTPEGEPSPYINQDNRTMVPVRFFANALNVPNSQIGWNQVTQTATVQKDTQTVSVTLGARFVVVNDVQVEMDTQAEMKDGRVFIPARFIAEGLGATVGWDQATKTVILKDAEEPEEIDFEIPGDEVFNDPNLIDKASTGRFDYVDGKLLFKYPGDDYTEAYEEYEIQETLNPQINEQVLNVTKVLLDGDHYVETKYLNHEDYPNVKIGFAINQMFAYKDNHFFSYLFYEQNSFNLRKSWQHEPFSDNAVISLTVRRLWQDINEPLDTPFYVNRLRDSLLATFGEQYGVDIFEYAIGKYRGDRIEVKEVKTFGNIQVDYVSTGNATLSFYFSYLQGDQ